MNIRTILPFVIFGSLLLPLQVLAQQCDAHYTFDGNIQDSGGNGYHGQMIGKAGASATPRFVEGKFGQGLQLDGTSAMRSFIDLHLETCPQVTVTAWIQSTDTQRKGTQYLVSTGSGSGPGLRVSGTNLTLSGTANGIIQGNAVRANAGWMFIAGVYDYEKGSYTLYWRNRSVEKELGNNVRAPEEALWVGAFNDGLAGPATGILIDDLHIYGRALRKEEIRKLQIGETEKNLVATDLAPITQPGGVSNESLPIPTSIPDDLLADRPTAVRPIFPSVDDLTTLDGTIYSVCKTPEDCPNSGYACSDITIPAEGTDGSMCTRICSDDSQCSSGNGFSGACYSLGGLRASCYQRCDRDNDCNSGNQCISVTLPSGTLDGVCVPDRPEIADTEQPPISRQLPTLTGENTLSEGTIYSACQAAEDCTSAGYACSNITIPAEGTDGSMCTRICSDDSQCSSGNGFSGACYSLGGLRASCYQRCDRDNDCNPGNQCISVTLPGGTLDGVCVPD